jgi:methionyl-tRNA formyltransferase
MGTPEFALPALERILDGGRHQVVLVVTQPDRPKGRGQVMTPSPVRELAEKRGLPVITPKSVRKENVAEAVRATGADACVVAAFGQILPDDVLAATRLGCLNIHPSLLPAYRGAAPIQRCLLEGNDYTGVTIMKLVRELDAGPIVAQQRVDILPDDDARSLGQMCAVLGGDMLARVLDEAEATGQIEVVEQDHDQATYAPPIKKEEGLIHWNRKANEIMFQLRALTPWPGAYAYVNGERLLIVVQAEPRVEDETQDDPAKRAAPGTVIALEKGQGFVVQAGDGPMPITQVKPEGKALMDAWAFVVGRGVKLGDVLGPPRAAQGQAASDGAPGKN